MRRRRVHSQIDPPSLSLCRSLALSLFFFIGGGGITISSTSTVILLRPRPSSSFSLSLSSLFAQTLDLINGGRRTLFQIHGKHNTTCKRIPDATPIDRSVGRAGRQADTVVRQSDTLKSQTKSGLESPTDDGGIASSQTGLPSLPASIFLLRKVWLFPVPPPPARPTNVA